MEKNQVLQQLSRLIRDAGQRHSRGGRTISSSWAEVDQALADPHHAGPPGLDLTGIHEFYGPLPQLDRTVARGMGAPETLKGSGLPRPRAGDRRLANQGAGLGRPAPSSAPSQAPSSAPSQAPSDPTTRTPTAQMPVGDPRDRPLCVMAHLARQALLAAQGQVVWVGRACWPNAALLARMGLLERSLLVDAPNPGERLWAIDLALRSPAVACVVGDGQGLKIAATRRLQLAAEQHQCLVLLGRPGTELAAPSAAWTRWALRRRISESLHPAWTLELVHCKGVQSAHGSWALEWDCAKGAVIISAPVVDRRAASPETEAGPLFGAG